MRKKFFLLAALFVTVLLISLCLFQPRNKNSVATALFYLKQNDLKSAEKIVHSLPLLPHRLNSLYRGYIEQFKADFLQSDYSFLIYLNEAQSSQAKADVYCALAANAYADKRDKDFQCYVNKALLLDSDGPAACFLGGLKHYLDGDYAKVVHLWHKSPSFNMNDWLSVGLEKLFPPSWQALHLAHSLLETGEISQGREILEKELNTNPRSLNLAALFLGFSYLKEARSHPHETRSTFYKMTKFYFSQTQSECPSREKGRLIAHIEEEAKSLLLADSEDVEKWGYEFVHLLSKWGANESLERLSSHVIADLSDKTSEQALPYCSRLREAFSATAFHSELNQKIKHSLSSALKSGKSEKFMDLWLMLQALSEFPKMDAKEIANLTIEEIFETIKKDNLLLDKTRSYICFWQAQGRQSFECDLLARDLFYNAKLYWQNENQEKKGLQLMEIALNLASQKAPIEQQIVEFLTSLYSAAQSSHMIRRLVLIYDAMEHFGIVQPEIFSKETLANHLADAEYLFEVHNFPEAISQSSLVLKLDPENEKARRLTGLCAFNMGEYKKALALLQELKNPDVGVYKALALSQMFVSQERCLCQSPQLPAED